MQSIPSAGCSRPASTTPKSTLDLAVMAIRDEYDVGILFSTDTDLKPALELVADLTT
jgi:uncharacterized LabA/DUF88 family protein